MAHNLDRIRHSAAHVLAMAAIRLFPDTKIGIGPVTKEGFYYDFEFPQPITWEDVKNIETEMNLIIQENLPFTQLFVSREQAFDILLNRGQIYKAELLRDLPDEEVSFFKTGEEFIDLCRGPHVASTGEIGPVKLTSLSGAYWKSDETRPQLQRITGTAFLSIEDLKAFLAKQDAIKDRDFRKLARTLNLTLGGNRLITYTPEGTLALKLLMGKILPVVEQIDAHQIISASAEKFEDLEKNIDAVFGLKNRSYKELPIRYYTNQRHEFIESVKIADKDMYSLDTVVYKVFCEPQEAGAEIKTAINAITTILRNLQLNYSAQVLTPDLESPHLSLISDLLQRAIVSQTQIINPKLRHTEINFILRDSLDREWTLISCHVGHSEQQYISRQGEFMPATEISFQIALEEVLAYLIEDQEGILPLWLAPVQIVLIPITDAQHDYAEKVGEQLKAAGFRSNVDTRSETMQAKIRDAEISKIPTIVVIGDKEQRNESVSLRQRNNQEIGLVSLDRLVETIQNLK